MGKLHKRLAQDLENTFFDTERGFAYEAEHFEDLSDPTPQFVSVIFDEPFNEYDEGFTTAARSQPPMVHTESRWGIAQDDYLDIKFTTGTRRFRVLRVEDDGTGVDELRLQEA